MAVRSPQDIYARHVSSSRGYPLWTPEPSTQLLSHRPEGLKIGDVGVVSPENGAFDVFFNVCLPKDHHFHRAAGVPEGFSSVELSDADVKTVSNAESAGQVVAPSSVTRVGSDGVSAISEALPRTGQSGAVDYTFKLSAHEGALLVLPEGAESHDVRDARPFFEQASRHAETWYRFAEGQLGRLIAHDAIYVITGFHKARSWGLAGYENDQGGDFSARFTIGVREGGSLAEGAEGAGYSWEMTRSMDWRVGPLDGRGIANQSVFVRGLKIALRSSVQGLPQRWVSGQPSRSGGEFDRDAPSGDSWLTNAWRGISKTMGVSSDGAERDVGGDLNEVAGMGVEIQRIPEILPVFHPSDVINQYILQREPSAKVAITHDDDWGALLDKSLLKSEELVQDELLTKAVSERYTIISRDGVAHLQGKSGSDASRDNFPIARVARQALVDGMDEQICIKGANGVSQPDHSRSLNVVSESNYRCVDESASGSISSKSLTSPSQPADLQSIPSKLGATCEVGSPTLPESIRPIKIIVISDFVCGFCYICDKILRNAIAACRDLPLRFDVEFRPLTIVNLPSPLTATPKEVMSRNAYVIKRFGKEQAEIKFKAVRELGQKAGLEFAVDSVLCKTTEAHRLCTKAYRVGGQDLQNKLVTFFFDACLTKGANIGDHDVLVDAAVGSGLMNKDDAVEFLRSTECSDCVEKMVEAARAQGINGVPFVIIDGKWAVNGLQPTECFIQIFRKLAHSPCPKTKAVHKVEAQ